MAQVTVIDINEIKKEPKYNASDSDTSGTQKCPLDEKEPVQTIKKMYFTDVDGNEIDKITVEEEVCLVLETENMAGESVVIRLQDNQEFFKLQGEHITQEKALSVSVSGDVEKIKLEVVNLNDETIRGTKKSDFTATCQSADDETKEKLWEDFKNEDWESMEKTVKEKGVNGGWPPNDGFKSKEVVTLKKGTPIDRYDGDDPTKDRGKFASPAGADFSSRALPEKDKNRPQYDYTVEEDIQVTAGEAIPWFGQKGGGAQYKTEESFKDLLKKGEIKIKIDERN